MHDMGELSRSPVTLCSTITKCKWGVGYRQWWFSPLHVILCSRLPESWERLVLEQVCLQGVVMGRKVPTEVTVTVADKCYLVTSSKLWRPLCNNGVVTSDIVFLSAMVAVPSVGSVTFSPHSAQVWHCNGTTIVWTLQLPIPLPTFNYIKENEQRKHSLHQIQ